MDLFGRKKKRLAEEQAERERIAKIRNEELVDANRTLRIIRTTPNLSSVTWQEVAYRTWAQLGGTRNPVTGKLDDALEERVDNSLKLLKEKNIVGWGGHRGDSILFNKNLLPGSVC